MHIQKFNYEGSSEDDFACNSYVVGELGGPAIVVDPGSDRPDVENYIHNHHSGLVAILLTHVHFDHVRGVERLIKEFDPKIYLYYDEKDALSNKKFNCTTWTMNPRTYDFETIDVFDEEVLELIGVHFKVIFTPFHTKGSVCYYLIEDKVLFSGDSLFKGSIGRTDLANSKPREIISSLAKLRKLDDDVKVCPGHDSNTIMGNEKKYNPYLNER